MTYEVGNPGSVLGQAQKSGDVKPVNGIPNVFIYILFLFRSSVFSLTKVHEPLIACLKQLSTIFHFL